MNRLAHLNSCLLTLLCLALIVGQASGAHLHLCFDGADAAASIHLVDLQAEHTSPELDVSHKDVDIALLSDSLTKRVKFGADIPLLQSVLALLLFTLLTSTRGVFDNTRSPVLTRIPHTHPPLRAPPR